MGKRLDYPTVISESIDTLESSIHQTTDAKVRDRFRMLLYLKTSRYKTQVSAGEALGFSARTSQRVWQAYEASGLAGLQPKSSTAGFGKLSSVEISRMLQRLDQDDIGTQLELKDWLKDQLNIEYTQAGIHYLLKRLKVKLKTGRPTNVRKDPQAEQAFKKKSRTDETL